MKPKEEEFFNDLISKSKLEIPFPDFEEQVMMHIKEENVILQQPMTWEIKFSWVFFILLIIVGTGMSLFLSQMQINFFGVPPHMLKIVFEFVFIVYLLMQLDSLLKHTFRQGHKIHLINQLRQP